MDEVLQYLLVFGILKPESVTLSNALKLVQDDPVELNKLCFVQQKL